MTKIINKADNTTIFEVTGNVTLDEAIDLCGEYSNDNAINGDPDTRFGDNWYYYDDLEAV